MKTAHIPGEYVSADEAARATEAVRAGIAAARVLRSCAWSLLAVASDVEAGESAVGRVSEIARRLRWVIEEPANDAHEV